MTRALILVAFVTVVLAFAQAAQAMLIQDNFESYATGAGVPPGWVDASKAPSATWEIAQVGGNKALKGASGPISPESDAIAGPATATGWYVENFKMEVSFNVLSGDGGGVGMGQLYGATYTGNSYYIGLSVPFSMIGLYEEGLSAGTREMQVVTLPSGVLNYGQWYDLRMVSTGTTFQVWFRPHTTDPWQESQKIIEVPQDLAHPGHKSYVDGVAACWVSEGDGDPARGASTMLFDDFRLEAAPFPAAEEYSDEFADATRSLANWSQHWCTLDFPTVDGSQVARFTTAAHTGGIGLGLAKQYYTHNFVLRTSMCVDTSFSGGVIWGWEGTGTADTDFHIEVERVGGNITLDFDEEQNSTSGTDETQLAWYQEPEQPGVYWYSIQVRADYRYFYVWWWKRGDPKPASPVITIQQDLAHPGYRLVNLGGLGLWQNDSRVACFDDFFFHGTPVPAVNAPEGTSVQVEPEPGLSMTFDAVSEGGTASVETSTTAPGGGPGGLEFQGLYYDINTTCVYSGPITIALTYDDAGMTPEQEANLRLMHWVTANQQWTDITQSVDTAANVITGVTDSLSVFAIATLPVFQGFLEPVNMPPSAMSVFKQKSTIPVKFKLLDAATGAPVSNAVATIWGEKVAQGAPSGVNEPIYSTQPDGGNTFRYDPAAGQYIFNLSTRNLASGTIYRIHANIMGGLMDRWVDVAVK